MKKRLQSFAMACVMGLFSLNVIASDNPRVLMQTNFGNITLELDAKAAPKSVANFLEYVKNGDYEGTIFHRVIKDFMIQGGGFTTDYTKKTTRDPIKNEADNGLANVRGSISMARTNEPNSATNQFFINTVDNGFLNHTAPTPQGWGYAVFGKVVEGMETVDKIAAVKTGRGGPFWRDAPQEMVIIEKVTLIEQEPAPEAEKAESK